MIEEKTLLVIDDRVEYLDAARAAYESIKDTFEYKITFCGSFDLGIEEVRSGKYTHVLTDLFEGEETPKGLLVLIAAKEKGLEARIVTDGNRHRGNLGSIRYALWEDERLSYNSMARGPASEGRAILGKMGLKAEEVAEKIGPREFECYLIGTSLRGEDADGGHSKSTESDWKEIYRTFEEHVKPIAPGTIIPGVSMYL